MKTAQHLAASGRGISCGRRLASSAAAALLAFAVSAGAAGPAGPASGGKYTLMINDGGSSNGVSDMEHMYGELAKTLSAASSRQVQILGYTRTAAFEADYRRLKPEILFIKTIDLASKAIRDDGYTVLAKRADPYVAGIVANPRLVQEVEDTRKARVIPVKAGAPSPRFTLDDLRCHELVLPDRDTFTSKLAIASLRQVGIPFYYATSDVVERTPGCDSVAIRHVRYQEAVLELMAGKRMGKQSAAVPNEQGVKDPGQWYHAAAGAINPTMLGEWKKDPKRALVTDLPPMPNWAIVVHKDVPQATREAMRAALMALDGKGGETVLQPLRIKKLAPATDEEYLQVLRFIGG